MLGGVHGFFLDAFGQTFDSKRAVDGGDGRDGAGIDIEALLMHEGWPNNEASRADGSEPLDRFAAKRESTAHSLKVAMAYLRHIFESTYIMRICLEPQHQLMHKLLHVTGNDWEFAEMSQQLELGRRALRGVILNDGDWLLDFYKESFRLLLNEHIWRHLTETEELRSDLCRFILRAVGVVKQLVESRVAAFLFKLFSLLKQDELQQAATSCGSITQLSACCPPQLKRH